MVDNSFLENPLVVAATFAIACALIYLVRKWATGGGEDKQDQTR